MEPLSGVPKSEKQDMAILGMAEGERRRGTRHSGFLTSPLLPTLPGWVKVELQKGTISPTFVQKLVYTLEVSKEGSVCQKRFC